MNFGNAAASLELIHQMAKGEGCGLGSLQIFNAILLRFSWCLRILVIHKICMHTIQI